eukprot:TRINITY_DN3521_c0_g1_i7.p1 TRINITY_DN3521_c0_g1~~TRINITY_DN3521_c0_g1_i7.p1  ORF type:complete len:251 (-),score=57.17 TRINITY_DN3521_c0_g1_i7:103-855(-)
MSEDNVALAFALTIGAGLSTTLGSLAPFITKMQSRRFLTASLASSAGVMLYVSFAEILDKSREYLEHDLSDSLASWYTTSSFFGGILFCWGLHKVVHEVEAFSSSDDDPSDGTQQVNSSAPSETASTANFDEADEALIGGREMHEIRVDDTTSSDGGHIHRINSEIDLSLASEAQMYRVESKKLKEMGMITALTIGIHNFPEGLATFVATLAHPHLGIAMAVAVALHNIPEGVCVSLPIFYATGSYRSAL